MNPFCIPPRTFFLSCGFGVALGILFMLFVLAVHLTLAGASVMCYALSLFP